MAYVITSSCIDVMDLSCIEECPVDCIYQGGRKLYINPVECIDCGACEPVCPQEAIYADWLTPAEETDFVGDNAVFFTEPLPGRGEALGNPHGARNVDVSGADTPLVASWPADPGNPVSSSSRPNSEKGETP